MEWLRDKQWVYIGSGIDTGNLDPVCEWRMQGYTFVVRIPGGLSIEEIIKASLSVDDAVMSADGEPEVWKDEEYIYVARDVD